jgi:Dolichyl-phosphate-mannose-protein mannosyltransferase
MLTGVVLFAAFMHLYLLNSYPPGLDPDSAEDGMDALKPLRYNVWPFYITINSNTDPIYIYTAAATTGLFGPHVISLRFASVLYALTGLAATYVCILELGRGSHDLRTRRLIALLAVAALAASQVIALVDRMGLRFITLLPFQMLSIWSLARAARMGSRWHWVLAGVLAGLTQYTYPSGRVLPLLWLLVLAVAFWQHRERRRAFMAGVPLFALGVVVALLPQIIWYAQYPQTFLARAGQTSFTQNPIYLEGGLGAVLKLKLEHYWAALTDTWQGQYNQIKEPLFAPLFLAGAGLGLGALLFQRRKWLGLYLLCGLLVMLLPDLISGDRDWPHELRLIGLYPFLAGLAGYGLASVWAWTQRWREVHRWAGPVLLAAVAITFIMQAREFFDVELNQGKLYWSGNVWLRRVDYGIANHITATQQPVLLPLLNYSDTVVKYLTASRAVTVRSALDRESQWLPTPDGSITVLLPNGDDNSLWQGDPESLWVMFDASTVYILPPLPGMNALLPVLNEGSLLYDFGLNSMVQIGHARQISPAELPPSTTLVPDVAADTCFIPGMCLTGATYNGLRLQAGSTLKVNLFWQVKQPIKNDYVMFVHLLDRNGNVVSGLDEYPLSHGYRTYEWRTDETIVTQTRLPLPAELNPGRYSIETGFYLPYDLERVPTADPAGNLAGNRALLPHLKVALPPVTSTPQHALSASFGQIELLGYDSSADAAVAGDTATLTFYWRSLQTVDIDYTAFVHVQAGDVLVGQADVQPGNGVYPTSIWDAGEVVTTTHTIQLAADAPAGPYKVFVGWYAYPSGERLASQFENKPTNDGRVEVTIWP